MSITSCSLAALGSVATVHVTDERAIGEAERAVREVVDDIDRACSRFRQDSDLSKVNAAGGRWVSVSATFLQALAVAVRAARLTDGDLDPTVGQAVIGAGYDRDFVDIQGGGDVDVSGNPVPGWRALRMDGLRMRASVADGCSLDLGATAKALASDQAAARVTERLGGSVGVAVSLGGDVSISGPPPPQGWRIGVAEHHAGPVNETIASRAGGIATSTTTARSWVRGGRQVHHLIDPGTGRPAEVVWRTATVAAETCVDANIASSTSIIRGQGAPSWLEGLGLPARLVRADGTVAKTQAWPSAS